jgi:hypothetical protein
VVNAIKRPVLLSVILTLTFGAVVATASHPRINAAAASLSEGDAEFALVFVRVIAVIIILTVAAATLAQTAVLKWIGRALVGADRIPFRQAWAAFLIGELPYTVLFGGLGFIDPDRQADWASNGGVQVLNGALAAIVFVGLNTWKSKLSLGRKAAYGVVAVALNSAIMLLAV